MSYGVECDPHWLNVTRRFGRIRPIRRVKKKSQDEKICESSFAFGHAEKRTLVQLTEIVLLLLLVL